MGLQACSSSGSDSSAATAFSDPVDALTLRSALTTGSSAGDDGEYWECTVADNSAVFEYRLMADGSGVENDLANPTVPSAFTWEAGSAATVTFLDDVSGMQYDLSNIVFTDRNNMSLSVNQSLSLACVRQGEKGATPEVPTAPAGDNALSYGSAVYGLTHGFEESFSYRPVQQNDTHSASDFSVADAPFTPTTIAVGLNPAQTIWRPTGGTVWFEARLFAPGGSFQSATFDYEPDSTDEKGPTVSGRFFFQKAKLGVDINQNGSIDSEDGEFIDVVGGSITVNRVAGSDNATMSFDVTLADGMTLAGNFSGQFVLF